MCERYVRGILIGCVRVISIGCVRGISIGCVNRVYERYVIGCVDD